MNYGYLPEVIAGDGEAQDVYILGVAEPLEVFDGYIIGDGRWLDGMPEEPTWQWNDIGTYYGTGVSGLNFYENMISFNVSVNHDGGKEPLNIRQIYPSTSWMDMTCSSFAPPLPARRNMADRCLSTR